MEGLPAIEAAAREAEFADIDRRLELCREDLNQATVLLNTYDTQKSMEELKQLQELVIQAKADLNPQKKFSFKSKKKQATVEPHSAATQAGEPAPPPKANTPAPLEASAFEDVGTQVRDLRTQTVSLALKGQDVALTDVTDSKVFLTEPTTAVRINKARSSLFVMAPVAGSVFLEDCQDCTFVVACHQVSHNPNPQLAR